MSTIEETPTETMNEGKELSLEEKLIAIEESLKVKETDKTWMDIEEAIKQVIKLFKSQKLTKYQLVNFIEKNKVFIEGSINTDRTRLTGTATLFMQEASIYLETDYFPIAEWAVPAILKLTARTNKVTVTRAQNALEQITINTKIEDLISYYHSNIQHISKSVRLSVAKLVLVYLNHLSDEALLSQLEKIEDCICEGAIDSTPEVRAMTRNSYQIYAKKFPQQSENFYNTLTDVAQKYLKLKTTKPASSKPISNIKRMLEENAKRQREAQGINIDNQSNYSTIKDYFDLQQQKKIEEKINGTGKRWMRVKDENGMEVEVEVEVEEENEIEVREDRISEEEAKEEIKEFEGIGEEEVEDKGVKEEEVKEEEVKEEEVKEEEVKEEKVKEKEAETEEVKEEVKETEVEIQEVEEVEEVEIEVKETEEVEIEVNEAKEEEIKEEETKMFKSESEIKEVGVKENVIEDETKTNEVKNIEIKVDEATDEEVTEIETEKEIKEDESRKKIQEAEVAEVVVRKEVRKIEEMEEVEEETKINAISPVVIENQSQETSISTSPISPISSISNTIQLDQSIHSLPPPMVLSVVTKDNQDDDNKTVKDRSKPISIKQKLSKTLQRISNNKRKELKGSKGSKDDTWLNTFDHGEVPSTSAYISYKDYILSPRFLQAIRPTISSLAKKSEPKVPSFSSTKTSSMQRSHTSN
ncbi:hypothetical protein K502DRAFT_325617 [Neoconidiobolus thromboides FSU 785]|nr:hypothetical protein K502DRAFT_325617 [Neoconidiobolus thromboides FSU 785]